MWCCVWYALLFGVSCTFFHSLSVVIDLYIYRQFTFIVTLFVFVVVFKDIIMPSFEIDEQPDLVAGLIKIPRCLIILNLKRRISKINLIATQYSFERIALKMEYLSSTELNSLM